MIAFVGLDPINGTARLTYGIRYLRNGISLVPAMIGLYGMSEVFTSLIDYKLDPVELKKEPFFQHKIWWKYERGNAESPKRLNMLIDEYDKMLKLYHAFSDKKS